KQKHKKRPAKLYNIHHQAIKHFTKFFHYTVDFTCAHAYAMAVNRGIRTAINNGAASWGNAYPIAMPPHVLVHGEITVMVAFAIMIIPKIQRHCGHRFGHY